MKTPVYSAKMLLMFDEMSLDICEEYPGGETYGVDENGDLFKGIMSFLT